MDRWLFFTHIPYQHILLMSHSLKVNANLSLLTYIPFNLTLTNFIFSALLIDVRKLIAAYTPSNPHNLEPTLPSTASSGPYSNANRSAPPQKHMLYQLHRCRRLHSCPRTDHRLSIPTLILALIWPPPITNPTNPSNPDSCHTPSQHTPGFVVILTLWSDTIFSLPVGLLPILCPCHHPHHHHHHPHLHHHHHHHHHHKLLRVVARVERILHLPRRFMMQCFLTTVHWG